MPSDPADTCLACAKTSGRAHCASDRLTPAPTWPTKTLASRIAIAKFPSPANDDWDVTRWEAVALDLARVGHALEEIRAGAVSPDAWTFREYLADRWGWDSTAADL